jgi:hypothetical protein
MYVMQPVWQFFDRLDGFETAAVWIAGFTLIVITGALIDYVMQKQGFGVLYNSVLVAAAVFLGLYIRFAYARPSVVPLADPLLTIVVVLATMTSLITTLALLRNRFW